MKLISSIVVVACAACSSGGGGGGGGDGGSSMMMSSSSDDYDTEQVNGGCPSSPSSLKGSKGSGDACSSNKDCSPTCCQCPSSSMAPDNKWLAAECKNGKCASGSTACSTTQSSSFCQ